MKYNQVIGVAQVNSKFQKREVNKNEIVCITLTKQCETWQID